MAKHPKRPRDPNQLARLIVGIASGEVAQDRPVPLTPAQEFARSGGLKGGAARRGALTPERRAEIARKAAAKRWERLAAIAQANAPERKSVGSPASCGKSPTL